jgi:hypothetical protein
MFPSSGPIGLPERFEDESLTFRGNADSGILHRKLQGDFRVRGLNHNGLNMNAALLGELDRVSDEIQQYLTQPGGISQHVLGDIGGDGRVNLQALLMNRSG